MSRCLIKESPLKKVHVLPLTLSLVFLKHKHLTFYTNSTLLISTMDPSLTHDAHSNIVSNFGKQCFIQLLLITVVIHLIFAFVQSSKEPLILSKSNLIQLKKWVTDSATQIEISKLFETMTGYVIDFYEPQELFETEDPIGEVFEHSFGTEGHFQVTPPEYQALIHDSYVQNLETRSQHGSHSQQELPVYSELPDSSIQQATSDTSRLEPSSRANTEQANSTARQRASSGNWVRRNLRQPFRRAMNKFLNPVNSNANQPTTDGESSDTSQAVSNQSNSNKRKGKSRTASSQKKQYTNFPEKVRYLRSLPAMQKRNGTSLLKISRDRLIETSFDAIMSQSPKKLKKRLCIKFCGEDGVDQGGILKEFFYHLSRSLLDPGYGMFEHGSDSKDSLQINPYYTSSLDHYKFAGRLVGLAVFHGHLIDGYFGLWFYRHILGKTVEIADLELMDPEYYRSLKWMRDNDIEGIIDNTFSIEEDVQGKLNTIDLKVEGHNIAVTNKNKKEYLQLVGEWKLYKRSEVQFQQFLEGFHEFVPATITKLLNEKELGLLVAGHPRIDLDYWRRHTKYGEGYTNDCHVINWFWACLETWDPEQHSRLLRFVTGSGRIPANGFSPMGYHSEQLRFTILRQPNPKSLPTASTCTSSLYLPRYHSYHDLNKKLMFAIEETIGFDLI